MGDLKNRFLDYEDLGEGGLNLFCVDINNKLRKYGVVW